MIQSGNDCRRDYDESAFAAKLTELKQQGASVLVVGSVDSTYRNRLTQRLLGQSSMAPRRRIVVSTASDDVDTGLYPDQSPPESFVHIEYANQARCTQTAAITDERNQSVSTTATPSIGTDEPDSTTATDPVTTETLADVGIAISEAIERFEDDADTLTPGEVRLGMTTLLPFLETYGRETVFQFLHLINGRTRAVNGMGHIHLPVDEDAKIVSVLTPLFDATIELRERGGGCQERWTITNGTHSSGWLPMPRE
ncbi:hypothetical protein ACLI4U_00445 [Natrialbaceae archaeon A-CW2]